MTLHVEATYENGVLKFAEPLPLRDHQKVAVVIETETSRAEQSASLLRWTGELADLRRLAEDDEFGILESR